MASTDLRVRMLTPFRRAGETLLACGCNNSHSGNLSARIDDHIVITKTGAMLASLHLDDLIVTSLSPTEEESARASSELPVHIGIYRHTGCGAVCHGHAIWAVLAGWLGDELRPLDVEGAYYFGRVPVIECVPATASPALGEELGELLTTKPVAILRGHGVFGTGNTIEQAMQRVCSVNDSAHLAVEAHRLGFDTGELAAKDYLKFDRAG